MKMQIETPRLLIRPIKMSDAPAILEMDSNPNVLKYLPIEPHHSIEQSQSLILNVQAQYEKYSIGRVAVVLKETNEFLGWSGFKFYDKSMNNHINFYELGYRFLEKHWGKGYATEAAKACVIYGFDTLNLEKIYAVSYATHSASIAVLAKVGFEFVETFMDDGILHHWLECGK